MTGEKNALSFGRCLMDARLNRRISLETISKETRISPTILRRIEQEDHQQLPDEVFVKGFLRAYAQSLGLDGTEIVRRYLHDVKAYREELRSEANRRKLMVRFWLRLLFAVGILLGFIVVTVSSVSFFHRLASTADIRGRDGAEQSSVRNFSSGYAEKELSAPKNDPLLGKLLLKIVTLETTWIKVMIDGRDLREYHLNGQESLQLEASAGFNLLIANPAGVKLTLNGKPVPVYGLPGQFVNVQLP